jgi:hypothetical protein
VPTTEGSGECAAGGRIRRLVVRGGRVRDSGDAEVQHLDIAVVAHHDVFRLDVAMDDARGVRRGQRACDLAAKIGGELDVRRLPEESRAVCGRCINSITRNGPASHSPASKTLTMLGWIQGRRSLRLAREALTQLWVGQPGGGNNFDGDVAAQRRIPGAIHLAHAAAAKPGFDAVAAVQADPARESQARSLRQLATWATRAIRARPGYPD